MELGGCFPALSSLAVSCNVCIQSRNGLAASGFAAQRHSVGLCMYAGTDVPRKGHAAMPKMVAVPIKAPVPQAEKTKKGKPAARQKQGSKPSVLDSTAAAASVAQTAQGDGNSCCRSTETCHQGTYFALIRQVASYTAAMKHMTSFSTLLHSLSMRQKLDCCHMLVCI